MTEEVYQKATKLKSTIQELKYHIDNVKKSIRYKDNVQQIRIIPKRSDTFDPFELKNENMPVSVEEFLDMYLSFAEKNLEKMKKEFELLK